MSRGKQQVRDLRYGRRGNYWAPDGADKAERVCADLHKTRLKAVRVDAKKPPEELADPTKREWPAESLAVWAKIAKDPAHPAYDRAVEVMEAAR